MEGFTADVLVENSRMMHVFHKSAPGPVTTALDDGAYHLSFSLIPARDRPASE